MSAALAIKDGLIALANEMTGVTAEAGPTFGDARDGDVIIITLLGSQPSDPGIERQPENVFEEYSSDRAQVWVSSFTIEFWAAGSSGSATNLRRQTEFANKVREANTIGGLHAAALPDLIQGETNSEEGTDDEGKRWTTLEVDVRICHLATHAGGVVA